MAKHLVLDDRLEAAVGGYLRHVCTLGQPWQVIDPFDGDEPGSPMVEVTCTLREADPPESAMFAASCGVTVTAAVADISERFYVAVCGEIAEAMEECVASDITTAWLGINDLEIDGGTELEVLDNVRQWRFDSTIWCYDIAAEPQTPTETTPAYLQIDTLGNRFLLDISSGYELRVS